MFIILGNEQVLFLRLHLLQGIVAYHQGKKSAAAKILEQAKNELVQLTINDDDLTQLMHLGNFRIIFSSMKSILIIFIYYSF